jgi:hypothetical protein
LTCHQEVGRRSSRATMTSTDERPLAASISSSRLLFFVADHAAVNRL